MANTALLQVRTDAADKARAAEILDDLGTNLSAVVNMLLKQIIMTESVPFDISVRKKVYTTEEAVAEVVATQAFEGLIVTEEEKQMLADVYEGRLTGDEARAIIAKKISKKKAALESGR